MTKTKIEWADRVWNPVTGCTKVSEGCRNCYAERLAGRFWKDRKFTDVKLHQERLGQPFDWGKPSRVFVNSMSDLFHDEVNYDFIGDVIKTIFDCPQHTFLILTKRPERMQFIFSECFRYLRDNPLPNLWLGVSVEDQKSADERIPFLLKTPAAVRFLSCEPLLGKIDLDEIPQAMFSVERDQDNNILVNKSLLDWVIVGGESGPKARPMHPDWARSIRDCCVAADIPFFFKQWGEWVPFEHVDFDPNEKRTGIRIGDQSMVKIGKKKAGRLLDGREWNEFPMSETLEVG